MKERRPPDGGGDGLSRNDLYNAALAEMES